MRILHARVHLTLHELTAKPGVPLLLLHELYGNGKAWGDVANDWPGSVYALDFCGHGDSQWVSGGSYTPELLVADADTALQQLGGNVALAGSGIGAYVALLLAGARSNAVSAAVLLPGAGLEGGGAVPDFERRRPDFWESISRRDGDFDPMVRLLNVDIRPVDYAQQFATAARALFLVEDGTARPPWWEAVRSHGKVELSAADPRAVLSRAATYCVSVSRPGEK